MVLAYWFAVGLVVGVLGHFYLRARGEQGYNLIGECLLASLGAMSLGMAFGVMFGWGQIFARGEIKWDEFFYSGATALVGGIITMSVAIYYTLISAPDRR